MTSKVKFAILMVVLFWSSAFVGIRAGLVGYSPGGMALLRFLIASIVIYFIYRQRSERIPLQSKDLLLALLTGAIGIGIYNVTLNYGELIISAGMASFIISQSPIITTSLAILFLKERINLLTVVGMMVSVLGVGLISISSLDNNNQMNFYLGILYILIATFVGGLYSFMQKSLLKKYHVIDIAAFAIWGGTLSLLLFIPDLCQDIQQAPIATTLVVIYLGIFPAALTYLAWCYVLSKIPASRAVSFLYFLPPVSTLMEWLWLDEIPTFVAFSGGLIALLGVWIVNKAFYKKPITV